MINKGERLHNPFDLEKNPNIKWEGEIYPSVEAVFCEFESDLYGLRAGFVNLKNQLKEGFNTVAKLILKFAPPKTATNPHENDTQAYIKAVCHRMDRNPDDILTLNDLKLLGISIIYQEQGKCIYTDALINQAIALAGIEIHDNPLIINGHVSFSQWLRNIFAPILPK